MSQNEKICFRKAHLDPDRVLGRDNQENLTEVTDKKPEEKFPKKGISYLKCSEQAFLFIISSCILSLSSSIQSQFGLKYQLCVSLKTLILSVLSFLFQMFGFILLIWTICKKEREIDSYLHYIIIMKVLIILLKFPLSILQLLGQILFLQEPGSISDLTFIKINISSLTVHFIILLVSLIFFIKYRLLSLSMSQLIHQVKANKEDT
jgi:hypothetical protein